MICRSTTNIFEGILRNGTNVIPQSYSKSQLYADNAAVTFNRATLQPQNSDFSSSELEKLKTFFAGRLLP